MKNVLVSAAALIAAVGLGASASAQQDDVVSNARSLITQFDSSTVGPVLNELGVSWSVVQAEGETFIAANADGFKFGIMPTACTNGKCVGAYILTTFPQANPGRQLIESFNQSSRFSTVGAWENGTAYLSRYEIADYGITRGNLAVSIVVFYAHASQFHEYMQSSGQTISQEGRPEDMSAAYLNRVSAEAMGVEAYGQSLSAAHQKALDEFSVKVRAVADNPALGNGVAASEALQRGKLKN